MTQETVPDNVHDFQLRYVGIRFEGARLPVGVLTDLVAFRDLLASFVKQAWYARHTDKVKLPRGFDRSLSFDLVRITDGSAVPNLNWNRSLAQNCLPGIIGQLDELVEDSFEQFMQLIESADSQDVPRALTTQQVRALNKFGAGLKDDERIEFLNTSSRRGGPIYLNNDRRKRLLTRVKGTYETRIDGIGVLIKAAVPNRDDAGHIIIATKKFGEVEVPQERNKVGEEFGRYLGSEIQFDLQVEVDQNDVVRGVVEIHDLGLIDAEHSAELTRCRDRLKKLGAMARGWDDGGGLPIERIAIENAERLLAKRSVWCQLFKIFPTETGGVSVEFENRGWDYTVEFLTNGKVEMFGIEVDGDDTLVPTEFDGIDDAFLAAFDNRTGAA